ncbi:MAG: hypothetical protein D6731_18245 [Planctomycetota bacterium]|nr:MAG: hypothetical protein D6731_18245 [Planctomycetota bacterium]
MELEVEGEEPAGRLLLRPRGAWDGADGAFARDWRAACARAPHEVEVDCGTLELQGGVALARFVDLVRELAGRGARRVVLRDAPQMLAHTLYKAGLLRGGEILLAGGAEPDQPYAG